MKYAELIPVVTKLLSLLEQDKNKTVPDTIIKVLLHITQYIMVTEELKKFDKNYPEFWAELSKNFNTQLERLKEIVANETPQ